MENLDFLDWYNIFKRNITDICLKYYYQTNNRIEYQDLFQEASIILFKLYREKKLSIRKRGQKSKGRNFILKIIRDGLVDYIRKNSLTGTTNISRDVADNEL